MASPADPKVNQSEDPMRLPLSAKGMNPDTADNYSCDFCGEPATDYLFMSYQFCETCARFNPGLRSMLPGESACDG